MRRTARIARGFDRLAPGYDLLARAVFGCRLRSAQSCLLGALPGDGDILVIGGGSGWFLETLLAETSPRRVIYMDISAGMLRRARARIRRRRPADLARVAFVRGNASAVPASARFRAICTHFVLDLFTDATLGPLAFDLAGRLAPGGVWYVSDFQQMEGQRRIVSSTLLAVMYGFFRLTCGIEARRLPRIDDAIADAGLVIRTEQRTTGGMVRAFLAAHPSASP